MVDSKLNFLGYDVAGDKFGQKKADAFVKANLVHLRPCSSLSVDEYQTVQDDQYPILTPHLPCDVNLFKELLRLLMSCHVLYVILMTFI